jgi:hypothetical protein
VYTVSWWRRACWHSSSSSSCWHSSSSSSCLSSCARIRVVPVYKCLACKILYSLTSDILVSGVFGRQAAFERPFTTATSFCYHLFRRGDMWQPALRPVHSPRKHTPPLHSASRGRQRGWQHIRHRVSSKLVTVSVVKTSKDAGQQLAPNDAADSGKMRP